MDEGSEPKKVQTLQYSAPPLFFARSYRFRSTGVLIGSILTFVFASAFAAVALIALREPRTPPVEITVILCGAASALTFAAAGWTLYRWFVRGEIALRITEEGVEYWGRISSWPQIARIGGVRNVSGRVELIIIPAGALRAPRPLPTTPRLTPQQFASLMQSLQSYLFPRYPNVTIETEPRDEL